MKREEVITAFERFGAVVFHILGRLFARFIPNESERISIVEAAEILEMTPEGATKKLGKQGVLPCDEKGENGKALWLREQVLLAKCSDS